MKNSHLLLVCAFHLVTVLFNSHAARALAEKPDLSCVAKTVDNQGVSSALQEFLKAHDSYWREIGHFEYPEYKWQKEIGAFGELRDWVDTYYSTKSKKTIYYSIPMDVSVTDTYVYQVLIEEILSKNEAVVSVKRFHRESYTEKGASFVTKRDTLLGESRYRLKGFSFDGMQVGEVFRVPFAYVIVSEIEKTEAGFVPVITRLKELPKLPWGLPAIGVGVREWHNKKGDLLTNAALFDYRQGVLYLKTAKGEDVEIRLAELSETDQKFLRNWIKQRSK